MPSRTIQRVDDDPLVVRLRAGDEAAFTTLVHRYERQLLAHAECLAHSHAVAEEIVQETWLAVYEGIGRFEGRSSLLTWITRIMVNRAASTVVREFRAVPLAADDIDILRRTGSVDDAVVAACADDIDNRVAAEQMIQTVRRVLPQLPEAERTIWTMHDVEHLPAADVTRKLGLSPANQRVRLHRARLRLRRHLEPQLGRW